MAKSEKTAAKAPEKLGVVASVAATLNAATEQLGAPMVAHLAKCSADGQEAETKAMEAGRSGVEVADHAAVQRQRTEHAKAAQRCIAQAYQHLLHIGIGL